MAAFRRTGSAALRNGAAAAALLLATATPALAQDATKSEPAPLSPEERAFYKTLSFQTVANLADVALFSFIVGNGAGASALFLAANTVSAAALYYPYEVAWDVLGPPPVADGPTAAADRTKTLAIKTAGYQILTTARNVALSYAFTGAILPSIGFATAAFAMDTVIYAANDIAWDTFRPRAGR